MSYHYTASTFDHSMHNSTTQYCYCSVACLPTVAQCILKVTHLTAKTKSHDVHTHKVHFKSDIQFIQSHSYWGWQKSRTSEPNTTYEWTTLSAVLLRIYKLVKRPFYAQEYLVKKSKAPSFQIGVGWNSWERLQTQTWHCNYSVDSLYGHLTYILTFVPSCKCMPGKK